MPETSVEEPYLASLRRRVEEQYAERPTGCGSSFGEILCWEIHSRGRTFISLAEKWGIPVSVLGELIGDHCRRLEPLLLVNHDSGSEVEQQAGMPALTEDQIAEGWHESAAGEPEPSPTYLCRCASGRHWICQRVLAFGGPQWVHGGWVIAGVTHWKEIVT